MSSYFSIPLFDSLSIFDGILLLAFFKDNLYIIYLISELEIPRS